MHTQMYTYRERSASLTPYPVPQATPLQSGSPPDVFTAFPPRDQNQGTGGSTRREGTNGNRIKRLGGQ